MAALSRSVNISISKQGLTNRNMLNHNATCFSFTKHNGGQLIGFLSHAQFCSFQTQLKGDLEKVCVRSMLQLKDKLGLVCGF